MNTLVVIVRYIKQTVASPQNDLRNFLDMLKGKMTYGHTRTVPGKQAILINNIYTITATVQDNACCT